jgi:hypothetical protein
MPMPMSMYALCLHLRQHMPVSIYPPMSMYPPLCPPVNLPMSIYALCLRLDTRYPVTVTLAQGEARKGCFASGVMAAVSHACTASCRIMPQARARASFTDSYAILCFSEEALMVYRCPGSSSSSSSSDAAYRCPGYSSSYYTSCWCSYGRRYAGG